MDTGDLVAVDPSLASSGVALFRSGQLVACTAVAIPINRGQSHAARAHRMAQETVAWLGQVKARPRVLALEWPQAYQRSGVDPNTLFPLVGVSMTVVGMISMLALAHNYTLDVRSFLPREWIGQLPKSKSAAGSSPRALRIRERLSAEEFEHATPFEDHDMIDAIGIGLYALGRLEPKRARISRGLAQAVDTD